MSEQAERDILALLREQEAAVARGDVKAVLRPISDESVTYDLPPPLEMRWNAQAAQDGLRLWFESWNGPVRVTLDKPTVLIDGNLAVVFGLSRMHGTKKDGSKVDNWNRRTVVLRRVDGAWRIAHEHSSYPMLMDGSGKAATDLKP